jgi:hypothetical protein
MTARSPFAVTLALSALAAFVPVLAEDTPFTELPYTPSLDTASMDRTADPCEDLYQYSCGGWMKNNPLPGDQASWSVYGKLYQDNQRFLWGLLVNAAKPDPKRNATQQKIGDFFDACMDLEAVEKAGAQPLADDLARIAAMKSIKELGPLLGSIHARVTTAGVFFGAGVEQDAKESTSRFLRSTPGAWAFRIATITSRTTTSRKRRAPSTWSTSPRCSSCWATPPKRPRRGRTRCCGSKPRWPRPRSRAWSGGIPTRSTTAPSPRN